MQRNSASLNEHNAAKPDSGCGNAHSIKTNLLGVVYLDDKFQTRRCQAAVDAVKGPEYLNAKEQFFGSSAEPFESIHSNSKFSSLGGTHSIDKSKRKHKAESRKRSKPASTKKADKLATTAEPFVDPITMKNYRSANISSQGRGSKHTPADASNTRYQYHKRIRSDTGNTAGVALEQVRKTKGSKHSDAHSGHPSVTKAVTDITSPAVPSDDRCSSGHGRFQPTTAELCSRKAADAALGFKACGGQSNAHKISFHKIKKVQKQLLARKAASGEPRSQSQAAHAYPDRPSEVVVDKGYFASLSLAKHDDALAAKEVCVSDLDDYEPVDDDGPDDEQRNNRSYVPEIQTKIELRQSVQLDGDNSLSLPRDTDEGLLAFYPKTEAFFHKPARQPSDQVRECYGSDAPNASAAHDDSRVRQIEVDRPATKIVQIDCQSLDPLETTKSKDSLVALIRQCIRDTGEEPETRSKFYRVGKLLGRGAFGKVSLGMHKVTNQLVAIKSINKEFLEEERSRRKVAKEVSILKKLQHANIMNLYETFETEKHFLLVTELCAGGDLLNYVRRRRKLTEEYAKFFFRQLVEACIYCHRKGVVHRDIKLDNILLDHKGNLKLGDFGVSRIVK